MRLSSLGQEKKDKNQPAFILPKNAVYFKSQMSKSKYI